jgi:hypothetical protein
MFCLCREIHARCSQGCVGRINKAFWCSASLTRVSRRGGSSQACKSTPICVSYFLLHRMSRSTFVDIESVDSELYPAQPEWRCVGGTPLVYQAMEGSFSRGTLEAVSSLRFDIIISAGNSLAGAAILCVNSERLSNLGNFVLFSRRSKKNW